MSHYSDLQNSLQYLKRNLATLRADIACIKGFIDERDVYIESCLNRLDQDVSFCCTLTSGLHADVERFKMDSDIDALYKEICSA